MHRSAGKRLLQAFNTNTISPLRITALRLRHLSSGPLPPNPYDLNTIKQQQQQKQQQQEGHNPADTYDSFVGRRIRRANYQEEQARVFAASLQHVVRLGWSEAAMIAGARDVAVSPSIVGSIPRKEAALVEYFMDQCLQTLIHTIDSGDLQLQHLVPSERIAKLIKLRLQMQAPYISKWPQALSIQAQPSNVSTIFKQRAMMADEFCHASKDEGSGVDWYPKRSLIGGVYYTTEIYMLTDNSTDFNDTWIFLNERARDAFDLKKTFQEVQYFSEAVRAGLGSSLQGFTKKGF